MNGPSTVPGVWFTEHLAGPLRFKAFPTEDDAAKAEALIYAPVSLNDPDPMRAPLVARWRAYRFDLEGETIYAFGANEEQARSTARRALFAIIDARTEQLRLEGRTVH